jgi:DNA-binding HxlR family transcriptional regulator
MSAVPSAFSRDPSMDDLVGLLRDLDNGCDIYSRMLANRVRWLEERGLVRIDEPRRCPPANKQQPYFGAQLNGKGRRLLGLLELQA